MFMLYADKTKLTVRQREPVTSGSVNIYEVQFEFSPDWEGMERVAVFRAGDEARSILLDENGMCTIPWEVLASHGRQLTAGVCGTRDGEVVLPTVWAAMGPVLEGAKPGEEGRLPTPDLWEQELAARGDRLDYTNDGYLGLYAGGRLLSEVPLQGGEGGVSDHRLLTHKDAEEQHPIWAIDGLQEALAQIPVPMTADQLRSILTKEGEEEYA